MLNAPEMLPGKRLPFKISSFPPLELNTIILFLICLEEGDASIEFIV
jgi:hypothetical protein